MPPRKGSSLDIIGAHPIMTVYYLQDILPLQPFWVRKFVVARYTMTSYAWRLFFLPGPHLGSHIFG